MLMLALEFLWEEVVYILYMVILRISRVNHGQNKYWQIIVETGLINSFWRYFIWNLFTSESSRKKDLLSNFNFVVVEHVLGALNRQYCLQYEILV